MSYSNNMYKINRHKGLGPYGMKCDCCRIFPKGEDKKHRRNIRAKNKITTAFLIKEMIDDYLDLQEELYAEEWEFYEPFDDAFFEDWDSEYYDDEDYYELIEEMGI